MAEEEILTVHDHKPWGHMRGDGVRVLIVGAGIARLAAARTLLGWGASVEITERAAAPMSEGTGIHLPGNAVRAPNNLGAWRAGSRVRGVHSAATRRRHRGRLLFDGVGPCLVPHRAESHHVLLAGARDVPIRWQHSPQAMTIDDADVTAKFSDGGSDRYDLVLGADGLHSTARRLVFDALTPRPVGQYVRRFVVARPDAAPMWSVPLGQNSSF